MFRPRDPYKHRPLPYTIGSKEWQEKWHIGLVESDSDSASEHEQEAAESSSLTSSISSHAPPSASESDAGSVWGISAPPAQVDSQDIFEESSDEGAQEQVDVVKPKAPMDVHTQLTNELTKKLRKESSPVKEPEPPMKSIFMPQKPEPTRVTANLFDSEPPELDEPPSLEKRAGSQKPINLFLDDDEDDQDNFGVFGEKKTIQVPAKASSAKPINLFADDDNDEDDNALFASLAKASGAKPSSNSGLTSDLFANQRLAATRTETKASILSSLPPKSNLFVNIFDDEPPDDDFDFLTKPKAKVSTVDDDLVEKEVGKKPEETKQELKAEIRPANPRKEPKFTPKLNLFDDASDDEDDFARLLVGPKARTEPNIDAPINSNQPATLSKGLFDDVDDEDDNLFPQADTKSPKDRSSERSTGQGLFDDLTPEDEMPPIKPLPKAEIIPQGEYYNDFLETISASESNTSAKKDSVEQPPADKPELGAKSVSELRKSLERDSSQEQSPKPVSPEKGKPKKLNMGKFDINVSALLPGAKPVKQAKEQSPPKAFLEQETIVATRSNTVTEDSVDASERLTNLTRGRAKIQTRRPSTRRGRQQQYQRSTESESVSDEAIPESIAKPVNVETNDFTDALASSAEKAEEDTKTAESESEREKVPASFQTAAKKNKMNETAVQNSESLEKDSDTSNEVEVAAIDSPTEAQKEEENAPASDEKVVNAFFLNTEEDNDDSGDWLATAISENPIKEHIEETKTKEIGSNIFGEETVAEDDDWWSSNIGSAKETKRDDFSKASSLGNAPTSSASSFISEGPPPLPTMTSSTLFEDESEDDWSPPSTKSSRSDKKPSDNFSFSSDNPPPLPTSATKVFNEDEGSSDDLFSEKNFIPKTPSVAKQQVGSTQENKQHSEQEPIPVKKKADSFFDEDEDDFFDSPPSVPGAKSAKVGSKPRASASLFDDESSDDDDLFGALKKPAAAAPSKKTPVSKSNESKAKLFSDGEDEEDDDLFGARSKPSRPTQASSNIGQSRAQKTTVSGAVDNDPLADLLK